MLVILVWRWLNLTFSLYNESRLRKCVCNHSVSAEALSIAHQNMGCHGQVMMTSLNDNKSQFPTEPPFSGENLSQMVMNLIY